MGRRGGPLRAARFFCPSGATFSGLTTIKTKFTLKNVSLKTEGGTDPRYALAGDLELRQADIDRFTFVPS